MLIYCLTVITTLLFITIINYILNGDDFLFKGLDVPAKILARRSNFGQMTFLQPLTTDIWVQQAGVEQRFAGCKSITLTTEPWLILSNVILRQK